MMIHKAAGGGKGWGLVGLLKQSWCGSGSRCGSSQLNQCRFVITKVRLKWVKNRSLDHIIDTETDLKAACLLKDAIKRSSAGFITSRTVSDWQKLLGLTVPVLRFLRRYPTLFLEFPHSRYPSLPCFKLTDAALLLDSQEQSIFRSHQLDTIDRLCKLLMMAKSRKLPFQSLHPLKWDLGLPDDFDRTLVPNHPQHFRVVKDDNGLPCLGLSNWRQDLAVSVLQKNNETCATCELGNEYRDFKRGKTALSFPMNFPKGYGAQKKVRSWMEEFQRLPYISPYEDSRRIDPSSELMEKRVVGVLHEILSLTIHKKTKRNYLRSLRYELNIPHKFTRIFTRYPGIFYLSLKCKTTTVALKEGYRRGKLVNPHPLARIRDKYCHVMRTGVLYRNKGLDMIPQQDLLLDDGQYRSVSEDSEEDEECDMDGVGRDQGTSDAREDSIENIDSGPRH